MTPRSKIFIAFAAAALLGGASVALAQSSGADPVVEQARAGGIVGEQADGYLGFAKTPPADLKSRVDAINIKRRAIYTDLAAQRGVTVQEVAAATACQLFQTRVAPGEAYRSEAGIWGVRNGAVQKPSYCP